MPGRFAGPFNLFRDANTKERLVKNYAAKLLANAERIVDRPGGSQFQKLVSQHGDLLFTAMVDKTGPRPLYRVFVTGVPLQVGVEEQVAPLVATDIFMESGFCNITTGTDFAALMYYTTELQADLAALAGGATLSWLDWLFLEPLSNKSRPYIAGMDSLSLHNDARALYALDVVPHSGKGVLMAQAISGTRDLAISAYQGTVIGA